MPPIVAIAMWLVLLLALLAFDPAKTPKTSLALWVPVIWLFILGSRGPSQWIGGDLGYSAEAMEEGNPIDHIVFLSLILLAVLILALRNFPWAGFLNRNIALMTYLFFALLSVTWSDFPFNAFKHWFRDLGNYVVILVVLSDPDPLEATRSALVLRRFGYLLLPLSVVFIKYFPENGKAYDTWTGGATYIGATTSKNMLGIACLISGLYYFWDIVERWAERRQRKTKRIIIVDACFIAMTLWLLRTCDSATSLLCLVLGCIVIVAAHRRMFQRNPGFLKVLIPAGFILYLVLIFGSGMLAQFAGSVGRNSTLSGRTQIWDLVLSVHTNPFLGTGYESFWLGPRLLKLWSSGFGTINESHNGYLEVYLNLGFAGLVLLIAFLLTGYQTIFKRFKPFTSLGPLTLAIWTVFLFHNITEADFRSGPLWLVLLLGTLVVPGRVNDRVMAVDAADVPEPIAPLAVVNWDQY